MPVVMSQRHSTHLEELKKVCALKIVNVKYDDSGVYSVVVENQYGSDDSTAQVIILSPGESRPISSITSMPSPVVKQPYEEVQREVPSPPKIIKHMQPETTVNEGQPILLNCLIESQTIPIVSFLPT
jgi:hypothetical protein